MRRVSAELSRGHPATRSTVGWASLTEAELQITALVAHGLTNRQVARRLFISRHTVDYHLRAIFRKLGINSRSHVTRLAVERDDL
jgi:DNA-binding CsgD family transcriptional regulator